MADIIKKNMTEIWASAGDVQAPEASKIRAGWVVESVPRQWWNWFENRQDNNIAYMLQKGIPEWDAETEYQTNKSYVQRNNIVYKATAISVNKDPALEANSGSWVKAFAESTPYLEKLKTLPVTPGTVPYIDAGGNAVLNAIGATGSSLLGTATAVDARAVINAQLGNTNLTALSGVSAGTNVLPYFNSATTMAVTTLTATGRQIISQPDMASVRSVMGLGTGALYNAQSSLYASANNLLMLTGAFGLGGYSIVSTTNTINVNEPTCPTGFYDVAPDTIFGFVAPIPGQWTRIIHQSHANAAGFATQIATANFTAPGTARMFVRKAAGSGWGDWAEIMTTAGYPAQTGQTNDAGNTGAAAGLGKLLRTGAFGVGARLDLRGTVWSIGTPSQMSGHGTIRGLGSAGQLGIPGLSVNDLGVLTVDAHWTDNSGIRGYMRTFSDGLNTYTQSSGSSVDQPWSTWNKVYTSANTTDLSNTITNNVTTNIQPTLNAKATFEALNVTYGNTDGIDPNTTEQPWLLTNHANAPEGVTNLYWYITTTWYVNKGTGNRMQTAVLYNITPSQPTRMYVRTRYDTGWTPWARADNNGVSASASKLATPRTLGVYGGASGSVVFDGTADVSIPISIVNDSHLHSISTVSGLQAALDVRTPNSQQASFSAAQASLETAIPTGQVVFSVSAAQAAAGFSPGCSFVRPGYFGVNLGLSNLDNNLRIGGYSMGAVSYPILHTGNAAGLGFGGTSGALGASGWTRLGNGLIIQWGSFTGNGNIAFPTAFPSACTAVAQMQAGEASGNVTRIALNGNPGNTSFNVVGVNPGFNLPARWIALGY